MYRVWEGCVTLHMTVHSECLTSRLAFIVKPATKEMLPYDMTWLTKTGRIYLPWSLFGFRTVRPGDAQFPSSSRTIPLQVRYWLLRSTARLAVRRGAGWGGLGGEGGCALHATITDLTAHINCWSHSAFITPKERAPLFFFLWRG
jgi:hypothetical protein